MGMGSMGGDETTLSEINVTPLVDVMLVLLIIFMVTTPMMNQGIPVELPKASQQLTQMKMEESSILTINRQGNIFLDDRNIPEDKLEFVLRRLYSELAVRDVFIRADSQVAYGKVVKVLDTMKRVGIQRVGMVTEIQSLP